MAFSSVLVAATPWLLRRRPWVHTEHWNGVTEPRSVGRSWQLLSFLRHVLRLPHVVTGVTQELAQELDRFSRAGATRVVPCVVPTPEAIAPYPPTAPLRLVGVGLVNERKNPLLAVQTIAWLRDRGEDVCYRWIGDGPLTHDARQLVEDLDLTDQVEFCGAVHPSQVQQFIAAAHMFFVPSSQENFFTAVAESIAAGRPAVAPRSGGFVEYCTPENSEIVDSFDREVLGRSILRARSRFRGTSPSAVAATVTEQFSPDHVANLFLTTYADAGQRE
jgi:glycosyltransferase involved in cell wall biosynthesis